MRATTPKEVGMSKPGFSSIRPVLCVDNVRRSLDHYRDVLGFAISWNWSEEESFSGSAEPSFACVCRGDCSLFLCEQGQGNPGTWICLNVASLEALDEIHEEYRHSGADIVRPPTDCVWGMREMEVRDIDGNVFRIGCPLANGEGN